MNSQKLSHSSWECKYHVVFIPKYRKKVLYGQLRQYVSDIIRMMAKQNEFWRSKILGSGILCFNSRPRRTSNP